MMKFNLLVASLALCLSTLAEGADIHCYINTCGDVSEISSVYALGHLKTPAECVKEDSIAGVEFCCGEDLDTGVRIDLPCSKNPMGDSTVSAAKPSKPSVAGDPHFSMFGKSHRKYDFHGACDLVFLENKDFNNGQGMRINIRTKIIKWWSKTRSGIMPFTIGGYAVRYRVLSDSQFQFKIFLENDQAIVLRSVKDFMKVDIQHHTEETFGSSMGLLGTYNEGAMMARDGKTILTDPNEFGQEWQVRGDEPMLFHNLDGPQSPESCTMPTPAQAKKRRLGEGSISREAAIKACVHADEYDLEDCVMDVMATGDVAMAGAF